MSLFKMFGVQLVISCLLFTVSANQLGSYNVDPYEISVSGISSGAAMAIQMHVAYSHTFKGVASIAGVPYDCAQGNLTTALTTCMASPGAINTQTLINQTKLKSSSGKIDPVRFMAEDRVFIWHGTGDAKVQNAASDKIQEFYYKFVDGREKIRLVKMNGAGHTFPTDQYGDSCSTPSSPYMSNCHYNGAYELLNFIHRNLTKPSGKVHLKGQLRKFDQTEFTSATCTKSKRFLLDTSSSYLNGLSSIVNAFLPNGTGSTGSSSGSTGTGSLDSLLSGLFGSNGFSTSKAPSTTTPPYLNSLSNLMSALLHNGTGSTGSLPGTLSGTSIGTSGNLNSLLSGLNSTIDSWSKLMSGPLGLSTSTPTSTATRSPGGTGVVGGMASAMTSLLDFYKNLLSGIGNSTGLNGGSGSPSGLPSLGGGLSGTNTGGPASMDTVGYIYVPSGCRDKQIRCKLHVALHGCKMGRGAIGTDFVRHAGYNEVAELNNIIIIYPLAVPDMAMGNPSGCWDWWGFTGTNYDEKAGIEMCAIKAMVDRVVGPL